MFIESLTDSIMDKSSYVDNRYKILFKFNFSEVNEYKQRG